MTFSRFNIQFDLTERIEKNLNKAVYRALVQNFLSGSPLGIALGLRGQAKGDSDEIEEKLTFTADVSCVCPQTIIEQDKTLYFQSVEKLVWQIWYQSSTSQWMNKIECQPVDHPNYLAFNQIRFGLHQFQLIQKQFADYFDLPNKNEFLRNGYFRYRGFDMRLRYSEHRADRFQIQLDLGACPKEWSPELVWATHRCLLSANHLGFESSGLIWGINPQSKHIVLSSEHSVWSNEQAHKPIDPSNLMAYILNLRDHCHEFWPSIVDQINLLGEHVIKQIDHVAKSHFVRDYTR